MRVLDQLKESLSEFNIKKLGEDDYRDLFTLQKSNPYYFSCEQDHPVTFEEAIAGLEALPPGTTYDQKFYIGFYLENTLIAIMDFIERFPDENTIFIGLFMVDGNNKRKGYGKYIIKSFIQSVRNSGFSRIRLGCIAENMESFPFWESMGFKEVDRVTTSEEGRWDWHVIVMNPDI